MASEAWTSTKGLSVYNVLLRSKQSATSAQIRAWLEKNWRADVDDEYVAMGVGYLLAKAFITEANGVLSLARPDVPLVRVNGDVDLSWA